MTDTDIVPPSDRDIIAAHARLESRQCFLGTLVLATIGYVFATTVPALLLALTGAFAAFTGALLLLFRAGAMRMRLHAGCIGDDPQEAAAIIAAAEKRGPLREPADSPAPFTLGVNGDEIHAAIGPQARILARRHIAIATLLAALGAGLSTVDTMVATTNVLITIVLAGFMFGHAITTQYRARRSVFRDAREAAVVLKPFVQVRDELDDHS